MFIREAIQEDYESVKKSCLNMRQDNNMASFGRINFIDYTPVLGKLREEFPEFDFIQEHYGLNVNKREEN
ncbi:MAG: hypothetical protein IKL08_05450 [Clostridia bacterium]|nr:hypothetical protein [Clostridia bacterium]